MKTYNVIANLRRSLVRTTLFLLLLLSTNPSMAQQQSLCGPVMGGAVINFSFECLNDAVFLIVANQDGWQYTYDGLEDFVGDVFNIHGIAFRETDDEIWIVLSTDLSFVSGAPDPGALNGSVAYGDLFINLGEDDFQQASSNSELFAVRFDPNNDSAVATTGVYSSVAGLAVGGLNRGFSTRSGYEGGVVYLGGVVDYGDLPPDMTYFAYEIGENVIGSGILSGSVSELTEIELLAAGYDFSNFSGEYWVGFKFEKSAIIDQCGVIGGDGTSCLDCAGIACGNTEIDECGVCGGNGSSCIECVENDYTALVETMRIRVKKQKRLHRKLVRKYGSAGKCSVRKVKKAYRRVTEQIDRVPLFATTCDVNPFCTEEVIDPTISTEYVSNSKTIYKQSKCVMTNWIRSLKGGKCNGAGCAERNKKRRKLRRRLVKRAERLYEETSILSSEIPTLISDCS